MRVAADSPHGCSRSVPGLGLVFVQGFWGALLGALCVLLAHGMLRDAIGLKDPSMSWPHAATLLIAAVIGGALGARRLTARLRSVRRELAKPEGTRDRAVFDAWLARSGRRRSV